jgi:ParB family chromosome partitioning protein
LPLDEEADQVAMCLKIESEKLNVRETEEAVRQKLQQADTIPFEGGAGKAKSEPASLSNHIRDMQQQLREVLGAQVDIRLKGKESGRLIVHFSSNDEFERIVGFLRKAS